MDLSIRQKVSQFSLTNKNHLSVPRTSTSQFYHRDSLNPSSQKNQCRFCHEHILNLSQLMKKQIRYQFEIQKLKQELEKIKKQNKILVNEKVITYNQYKNKMEQQGKDCWNRRDMQNELFQCKMLIQLLLTSNSKDHPQVKQMNNVNFKQKYSNLLLQNIRLQEKLQARDRFIEQKNYYPIYHYDLRITTLRKAVSHWYKKSQQQCQRMKGRVKDLKQRLGEDYNKLKGDLYDEKQNIKQNIYEMIQNYLQTNIKNKQKPNIIKKQKQQFKQHKMTKSSIDDLQTKKITKSTKLKKNNSKIEQMPKQIKRFR